MRCRNCNVDLPESYLTCPLCGEKAFDDAPLLPEIRTAEYPIVKTEKYRRNPFLIFILVWFISSVSGVILSLAGILSQNLSAVIFCAVPCIWTLIFRPFLIEQLYSGNYIVMNLWSFALSCATFCYMTTDSTKIASSVFFKSFLPICCLAVFIVLVLNVVFGRRDNKRAAPYAVLMAITSCIFTIVFAVTDKALNYAWAVTFAVSILILLFLLVTKKSETLNELGAKFSVQKSVKKYK